MLREVMIRQNPGVKHWKKVKFQWKMEDLAKTIFFIVMQ